MSAPRRSILSQIFSGLAYVAIGAVILDIFLLVIQTPGPERNLRPWLEIRFLKGIARGVNEYAMDHDFHYPADLKSVPIDYLFSKPGKAEMEFLASSSLKYFPPPDRVPGVPQDRNAVLLTYETDKWFCSITAGGEVKYQRKKREPSAPIRTQE